MNNSDLPKLALALEYADIGAGLYLDGGSDHAARLLAAAAEQLLGDLCRLLDEEGHDGDVHALLWRIAARHQGSRAVPRGHAETRGQQLALARASEPGGLPVAKARQEAEAYLRACWYLLESMGLEAVAPLRLNDAIERSTIHASEDF